MFFKKKNNKQKIVKFTLSENSIFFIKKYILIELKITTPINENDLDTIVALATQWELDMIDPLSKHGSDKTYNYPNKERNELADKFVAEITGQWDDDKAIPDFDDLNKRLGLI